jgi:hypothetical protein
MLINVSVWRVEPDFEKYPDRGLIVSEKQLPRAPKSP